VSNGGALANTVPGAVLTLRNGLTIGSVNTDTATLNVALNLSTPAAAPIALTTLNTTPILNGASGGTLINVSAAGTLSVGTTYAVMNYAGTLDNTSFGTFALGTLPNRVTAHLLNDATGLDLMIDTVDFPVWTGAKSNEWSTNTIDPRLDGLQLDGARLRHRTRVERRDLVVVRIRRADEARRVLDPRIRAWHQPGLRAHGRHARCRRRVRRKR